MTLLVSTIVNQARFTMNDPNPPPQGGNPLFSDSEMIGYVGEAQAAVLLIKPDANVVLAQIKLVAGAFQALPIAGNADAQPVGIQLLDILSNATDGSTVRLIDREALDHSRPGWNGGTQRKLARRFFYDPRQPLLFMVTPPNDGTGRVNAKYAASSAVAALGDALALADTYQAPLHSFVVSRCYAKQTARYDATKATYFMTEFSTMVTGRTPSQTGLAPTAEL